MFLKLLYKRSRGRGKCLKSTREGFFRRLCPPFLPPHFFFTFTSFPDDHTRGRQAILLAFPCPPLHIIHINSVTSPERHYSTIFLFRKPPHPLTHHFTPPPHPEFMERHSVASLHFTPPIKLRLNQQRRTPSDNK